jgi:hypothetical protein
MRCNSGTALLTATLLTGGLALMLNLFAIKGSNWRHLAEESNPKTLKMSHGFNLVCNTTDLQNVACFDMSAANFDDKKPPHMKKKDIKSVMSKIPTLSNIFSAGVAFQIAGVAFVFLSLLINVCNDTFAHNWNLYTILCTLTLTTHVIGHYISIVSVIVFVSEPMYHAKITSTLNITDMDFFYVNWKSTSLMCFIVSTFFNLIVISLTFFMFSYSTMARARHQNPHPNQNYESQSVHHMDTSESCGGAGQLYESSSVHRKKKRSQSCGAAALAKEVLGSFHNCVKRICGDKNEKKNHINKQGPSSPQAKKSVTVMSKKNKKSVAHSVPPHHFAPPPLPPLPPFGPSSLDDGTSRHAGIDDGNVNRGSNTNCSAEAKTTGLAVAKAVNLISKQISEGGTSFGAKSRMTNV